MFLFLFQMIFIKILNTSKDHIIVDRARLLATAHDNSVIQEGYSHGSFQLLGLAQTVLGVTVAEAEPADEMLASPE